VRWWLREVVWQDEGWYGATGATYSETTGPCKCVYIHAAAQGCLLAHLSCPCQQDLVEEQHIIDVHPLEFGHKHDVIRCHLAAQAVGHIMHPTCQKGVQISEESAWQNSRGRASNSSNGRQDKVELA
jgi:hypothetical protein